MDADSAEILTTVGYGLQSQSSYVLDVMDDEDRSSILMYVSGYAETGGGGSYRKEIAFACVTFDIDLELSRLGDARSAECTEDVYALVDSDDELDAEALGID